MAFQARDAVVDREADLGRFFKVKEREMQEAVISVADRNVGGAGGNEVPGVVVKNGRGSLSFEYRCNPGGNRVTSVGNRHELSRCKSSVGDKHGIGKHDTGK